jgi:hypothetical protein
MPFTMPIPVRFWIAAVLTVINMKRKILILLIPIALKL